MQVIGNIATDVAKKTSKAGKDFFVFRMAENHGKDEATRITTWYEVSAFISELDADLLSKGQFVKVTGRLNVQAFTRRNGELGASATLLVYAVEPVERKARPADEQKPSDGNEH